MADRTKYTAPALEKGLDVLELLSRENSPLNALAISVRLARSPSELFRMLQVLEHRGYIRQAANGAGFEITAKLFELGLERPQVRSLLEIAMPSMRELSRTVGQSCHLTMRSGAGIVVVARTESSEHIGFMVRIGHRLPLLESNSAVIHYAFLGKEDRDRWIEQDPDIDPSRLSAFRTRAERARSTGYEKARSKYTVGITDIAAPILRGGSAVAALTVPFVKSVGAQMSIGQVTTRLCDMARTISGQMTMSDSRL